MLLNCIMAVSFSKLAITNVYNWYMCVHTQYLQKRGRTGFCVYIYMQIVISFVLVMMDYLL